MKGYVVIKENEVFEIKELDLLTWTDDDNKTCYGVSFGNECVQQIEVGVFGYLKKLDCNNFAKAIRYIMKKGKLKDYTICYYDKDELMFYNGELELSKKNVLEEIVADLEEEEIARRIVERVVAFERMCGLKIHKYGNHYCIEDTPKNRLEYVRIRERFKQILNDTIEVMNYEL